MLTATLIPSVLTLLTLLAPADAATLQVGSGRTYGTINAAYSAANTGDIIEVYAGTYTDTLDLRGKDVMIIGMDGPWRTRLDTASTVWLAGSTFSGFTLNPAPATAVAITGNATVSELHIYSPASYGVAVSGGTATIQEVRVTGAGLHSFLVTGGAVTFRRSVSENPAQVGFAVQSSSPATLQNVLSIGGLYGLRAQTSTASVTNAVVVGASRSGALTTSTTGWTNSAFEDNLYVIECSNSAATFNNGVAWAASTARNCAADTMSRVTAADPQFEAWSAGASFYDQDFHPAAGSPMLNTGSGTDPDGSAADFGIFGGSQGGWTDRDSDGWPVLFDCDDHSATTYPGAQELVDGLDNDCNSIIEDDEPGDTGTGDTDTGTGDSDPPDPSTVDLDGDGATADIDCDEHNADTYPGAAEKPDYADNDCDEIIDEGTLLGDDDGDSYSEMQGDCNDNDFATYPGADDDQNDGIDNSCDGADENAGGRDRDGDGYPDTEDCDDNNPAVHPGVTDGINSYDDDCDGTVDEDGYAADRDGDGYSVYGGDCDDADATSHPGAADIPDDFIDQDCNGTDNYDVDRDGDPAAASGGRDCDDNNSTIYRGATETCGDGIDQDCVDGDATCEAETPKTGAQDCGCSSGGGVLWLGLCVGLLARRRVSA